MWLGHFWDWERWQFNESLKARNSNDRISGKVINKGHKDEQLALLAVRKSRPILVICKQKPTPDISQSCGFPLSQEHQVREGCHSWYASLLCSRINWRMEVSLFPVLWGTHGSRWPSSCLVLCIYRPGCSVTFHFRIICSKLTQAPWWQACLCFSLDPSRIFCK